MPRKKLFRYIANSSDDIIIQPGKKTFEDLQNSWVNFFGNSNPIVLELACGKGDYTTGLASIFQDKNFVGVDIKGNRLRYGAQIAKSKKLTNVGFLRTIIQNIDTCFMSNSIHEIWIIHPDPRPRNADARRRLTHPRFLNIYEKLLCPGGLIRLKTDDQDFFSYSLETLQQNGREILDHTRDVDSSPLLSEHYGIQTDYERIFKAKGRTICYLKARKNKAI